MKVLIVTGPFPPEGGAGTERIAYEATKKLKEKGVYVEVVCLGDPEIKQHEGIKTVRFDFGNNRWANLKLIPFLKSYSKNFDIIQTHTFNTSIASLVAGKINSIPVVYWTMGVYGDEWKEMKNNRSFGKLRQIAEKIHLNLNFDKILTLSEFNRELAEDLGVDDKRLGVVNPGPGTDLDKFYSKEKEPYVLFVGRLAKQKGIDYLLKAAKRLPSITFKLVGEGWEEERLREKVPENVEFLGYKSGEELRELYAKTQVFCLPSIGEGFGIVLLEAMASGCAIVSTVPIDYEGIQVESRNVGELIEAIKKLMQDRNLALEYGKKNEEKSEKYSWDRTAEELIDVYGSLLEIS